jgi:hypothetical protein
MSKSKRRTTPNPPVPRNARSQPESDAPLAATLRTLVLGLIVVRWLIPTESDVAGDTLWLVQLTLAAIVLWTWSCLRSRTFVVRCNLFDAALWALIAAHAISAGAVFLIGGDRRSALNMAWEWVGLGATFFLLRQTIVTALDARRLAAIVVALAVVLGGLGIWQHYVFYRLASQEYAALINDYDRLQKTPDSDPRELGNLQLKLESQGIPTDEAGRKQYLNRLQFSSEAFGPFALANSFAGLLLVMLVLAGELFRTLRGPRAPSVIAAWVAAFLVLMYCLILTKSRTAWTGLVVAIGVWGITLLIRNRLRMQRKTWLGIGLGAVIVLVLFAIAALGKGFDAEVLSEAPKSLSYRIQYWIGAARTVAASPIFGTGPGNFRQHYLRFKVPESSEEITDPHNWLLDLWASGGILAVVSFLACLALAVVLLRRGCGFDGEPATLGDLERSGSASSWVADLPGPALGFFFAFVAPVAAASGNFDVWQLMLLVAWIGVFAILSRNLGTTPLAGVALAAAVLGLLIHLSGAGGIEMPAIVQLLLVLTAFAFATYGRSQGVQTSSRLILGIGGAGVVLFVCLLVTGTLPVVNRRAAMAAGEQALLVDHQFERAVIDFGQAEVHDPFCPEPLDRLADAFFARWEARPESAALDSFAKARELLQAAMTLDPLNPSRYRRLGEFYLARFKQSQNLNDAQAAAEAFEQAVDRYPTDSALRAACATALAEAHLNTSAKGHAQRAIDLDEINHRWGHTDRYLSDETLTRLRRLAAGRND